MDITRTTLHLAEHTRTVGLSLSGLAVDGATMVLAPDEGAALVRLTRRSATDWDDPLVLPLHEAVDSRAGPTTRSTSRASTSRAPPPTGCCG